MNGIYTETRKYSTDLHLAKHETNLQFDTMNFLEQNKELQTNIKEFLEYEKIKEENNKRDKSSKLCRILGLFKLPIITIRTLWQYDLPKEDEFAEYFENRLTSVLSRHLPHFKKNNMLTFEILGNELRLDITGKWTQEFQTYEMCIETPERFMRTYDLETMASELYTQKCVEYQAKTTGIQFGIN